MWKMNIRALSEDDILIVKTYEDKLKELSSILKKDMVSCDIKWMLFEAAAHSANWSLLLNPLPPQFITESNNFDIQELLETILITPDMDTLYKSIITNSVQLLNENVISLVYYVLVENVIPELKTLPMQEIVGFSSLANKYSNVLPSFVLEVNNSTKVINSFEYVAKTLGFSTGTAYLNGNLDTFYNILHNGFSVIQSAVSSEPNLEFVGQEHIPMADSYIILTKNCMPPIYPIDKAWQNCLSGNKVTCIGICEYIKHPLYTCELPSNGLCTVDTLGVNTDLLILRYLLVYGNSWVNTVQKKHTAKEWITKHKNLVLFGSYFLILRLIQLKKSKEMLFNIITAPARLLAKIFYKRN